MINWYIVEQVAAADHAQRLRQAQEHQRVRRVRAPHRISAWWAALQHVVWIRQQFSFWLQTDE